MKKLFKIFYHWNHRFRNNVDSNFNGDIENGRDASGNKIHSNIKVVPGKLFEHYQQVLHGTDEILKNIK